MISNGRNTLDFCFGTDAIIAIAVAAAPKRGTNASEI
jgi:hypothetical protein